MTETVRDKLNRETARIDWQDLAPHFARGHMWCVKPEADLIEVAASIAEDKAELVQQWQQSGALFQPTDADAVTWNDCNQSMWATVIAPWVFVQCVQEDAKK